MNDRQNPITGATNWDRDVSETKTVAYDTDLGAYGFRLSQYPRNGSLVVTGLDEITTGTPLQGQYRADYQNKTGWVQCSESDAGNSYPCTYDGGGTPNTEANLNDLIDERLSHYGLI